MTADAAAPGATTAPALLGASVKVVYRRRTVVDVPRIEVPAGKTYALLGASGAGKSTLLRVLGLLEKPAEGRVLIDGVEASGRDLATRRTIAAVFQKPYLLRATVGANVGYGLKLRRVAKAEREARVSDALSRVGLAGWEGRSALTLSGGEAQRVALARAIVLRPQVLLLDEPLSYMDPLLKRSLTLEFAEILKSEHVTALYVTHDQDEAAVVADVIGIMREGRIVAQGEPRTVLALPSTDWLASFLGMEPPLEGVVDTIEDGLARISVGGLTLWAVPTEKPGTPVLVGIRPEDVLLFEPGVELPKTSARNRIEGTVAEMNHDGKTIKAIPTDLSDIDAIEPLIKSIYDEFGSIDLLLNVAGYAEPAALLDTTIENLKTTYFINVFATIVITRECVKYMRNHPSKILNVASTAGVTPRPGWLAYASSKAAVVSMGETLTQELAEYGIKVYTISPGRCATELRRKLAPEEDPTTIMQPEDVATVIANLIHDDETCLDGQNLVVRQLPAPKK